MSKRAIWGLSALALATAVGLGAWWFLGREPVGVTVRVATVQPTNIEQQVFTTGTVIPNAKQEVIGLSTGKVGKIFVKKGDKVTVGQALVQMDTTLHDAQIAQAQASVATARSNLTAAQENLNNLKRSSDLEVNFVSPLDSEFGRSTEAAVKQAELAVSLAENQLKQAQEGLRVAQAQRDQNIFKSSINGTVLEVNAKEGSIANYNTPLVVVADLSKLRVQAKLNEVDASRVKVGQEVEASSRSLGEDIIKGKVAEVAAEAVSEAFQGNAQPTVGTVIDLERTPSNIKPGFIMDLTITTGSKEGVLAVPQEAIFQENNKAYCYRIVNNTVEKTEVELGIMNLTMQEITSGLQAGDRVVLAPSNDLKEGIPVQIVDGSGNL